MKLRIGPVLIITFDGLKDAVEAYAEKYGMLKAPHDVHEKWVGGYLMLILFCRMLFGMKK